MPRKHDDSESAESPQQKWETILPELREKIIRNVWCPHCRDVFQMVDYRVYSAGLDILLRGQCGICHGKVARVLGDGREGP